MSLAHKRLEYRIRWARIIVNKTKNWCSDFKSEHAFTRLEEIKNERDNDALEDILSSCLQTNNPIPSDIIRDLAINTFQYYIQKNDFQKIKILNLYGLEACRKINDSYSLENCYPVISNQLGIAYRMLGDSTNALISYQQAFRNSIANDLRVESLVNMADVSRLQGKYSDAQNFINNAWEFNPKKANLLAKLYKYQGLIYQGLKQFTKAIKAFEDALYELDNANNILEKGAYLDCLSTALTFRGKKDDFIRSTKYAQMAVELARKNGCTDIIRLVSAYLALAQGYHKQKKHKETIKLILEISPLISKVQSPRSQVLIELMLGYSHIKNKKTNEAIINTLKVYELKEYITDDDKFLYSSELSFLFIAVSKTLQKTDQETLSIKLREFIKTLYNK